MNPDFAAKTGFKSAEGQTVTPDGKTKESTILEGERQDGSSLEDLVSKISSDKGITFEFTDQEGLKNAGTEFAGKTVNGYLENGRVVLNLQSKKNLNSVVGHEVTHVLEGTANYDTLKQTITEYAKNKGDYQERYDTLKGLYRDVKGADVNSELVADLVGDYLFTDQDFVNHLSVTNRNVFQKIYDEIKYLFKLAKAGSKEARELEKVKRAFERAYRENVKAKENTADGGVRYSLSDNKMINMSTGEKLDGNTYRVLETLSKGEFVSLEEITNLKEVQYGEQTAKKMAEEFVSRHPEIDYISINDVGTYMLNTNERIQLSNKIISDRLQEGSFSGIDKNGNEMYNGSVVKGNRLDVVIGLPGSGKSSSVVNPLSQFYQSVVVDSDLIKCRLPEFNDGLGSSLVHEESSQINTKLLIESLKLGNNIVLPIVGSKIGSVERYIALAKERGYNVNVHLNELPNGKALGRVLKRYFDEGRFISPEYVLSLGNKPTGVYEQIKQRSDVSGYSRWNNDVTKGRRPILAEISENNKLYAQYSASWGTGNRLDVGRSHSRSTSGEAKQIVPIKKASSIDDVFFDGENEPTRYSLSSRGQISKLYGNYNVSGKDIALESALSDIAPITEESSASDDNISPVESASVKQDDTESKKLVFTETFKQSVLKRFDMEKLGGYVYAQQQVRKNLPDSFFKPVTNMETGMVVNITPKGINETFKYETYQKLPKAIKIAKLATVELIPEAIEKGSVHLDDQANYHDEGSPVRYAYIYYDTEVEGQACQLKVDVRKSSKSGSNRLHVHSVILANKNADDHTGDTQTSGARQNLSSAGELYHNSEDLSSLNSKNKSATDIGPVSKQGGVQTKNYLSMEDFMNADASVWRNVEYDDEATQKRIAQNTHRTMVEEGAIVKVPEDVQKNVGQSYPDLRGMKKKDRLPILKESMNALKRNLRSFLDGFKNQSFEFEVNGKVLEAKLYNTGINEVLEKVTQEKANMLYTTEEIFKNSRYLYSTPDYDSDPNVYRWNYFYTPVQIGEETVGVRIAVRDTANPAESQIYNWGIKKDTSLDGEGRGTNNRISFGVSSDVSNNNISQNIGPVKEQKDVSLGDEGDDSINRKSHGASSDTSTDSVSQNIGPVKEQSEISQDIGPVAEGNVNAKSNNLDEQNGERTKIPALSSDPDAKLSEEEMKRLTEGAAIHY